MDDCACIIWIVIIIVVVVYLVSKSKKTTNNSNQDNRRSSQSQNNQQNGRGVSSPPTATRPNSSQLNKNVHHPTPGPCSRPTIKFIEIKNNQDSQNMPKVEDLHDALTGAPLNASLGLFQCSNCKVFYHADSYNVLKEINNSECASCKSPLIFAVTKAAPAKFGKEYKPTIVTLENYRNFVGNVVTFEGFAHTVFESRRGNDFAVMFEKKRWVEGFKLVFFRDNIVDMGGRIYVNTLARKTIKVRGLIVMDPTFGYEIVVSERGMILEVSS